MPNAGWVELDGRTAHFGMFHGKVDLDQRRLIECYFDSESLTPREAVIMIASEAAFHAHGQLHAYANVRYTDRAHSIAQCSFFKPTCHSSSSSRAMGVQNSFDLCIV